MICPQGCWSSLNLGMAIDLSIWKLNILQLNIGRRKIIELGSGSKAKAIELTFAGFYDLLSLIWFKCSDQRQHGFHSSLPDQKWSANETGLFSRGHREMSSQTQATDNGRIAVLNKAGWQLQQDYHADQ